MSFMHHSTKSSSFHTTDAPTGYHLPHPSTAPASYSLNSSPTLGAKDHKRFHSHVESHGASPYPVLEHSATFSSTDSDTHKHHHHHHLPNPMQAVHGHVAEFRYGHTTRAAKREARKSQSHPWDLETALAKGGNVSTHERYEEVIEDWKEKDEQAWAAELRKREAARRSCASRESIEEEAKVEIPDA